MKTVHITTMILATMLTTLAANAIDRNANMIDALKLDYASFSDSEYFGAHITGENAIKDTNGKWAILAGITGGRLSFENGPDFDALGLELGVKYYLQELTSISLLGGYTWSDSDIVDFETGSLTARIKQRFTSAYNPVSPYIKGEISGLFIDALEDSDAVVFRAMAGCDFMMSQDFALVFEGGISESENMDDGPDPEDGWLLSIAMQYYWK